MIRKRKEVYEDQNLDYANIHDDDGNEDGEDDDNDNCVHDIHGGGSGGAVNSCNLKPNRRFTQMPSFGLEEFQNSGNII